ncbi:alpha/beta-hydrolase [Pluteus cervinus]|uniref:Alpha/beta-hydrolase n=1 Tax=Pluteus cervinus TaxID=181527 RepID=A0ACD3AC08_9AGAR|nr:alpha/beta-hydrolase [Pluteus cervinus]
MRVSATFLSFAFVSAAWAKARQQDYLQMNGVEYYGAGIPESTYKELVDKFRYSSSAYAIMCLKPNNHTLVTSFNDFVTDTQGFVARDDEKREIVAAFRGSTSLRDAFTDIQVRLISFVSPGVTAPIAVRVHTGFLASWNAVAPTVISAIQAQLLTHPDYSIISTGHSLGGSLASLAGVALAQNFKNVPVKLFTYGQPRTGNPAYAAFANDTLGEGNIFRSVHTRDGVPKIIWKSWGYRHHGIEYWQTKDPSSASVVRKCDPSGEDPTCSASVPTNFLNFEHIHYFDIYSSTPFCW